MTIMMAEISEMLDICGYNKKRFDDSELDNMKKRLEREGYEIFDYAWGIVKSYYKMVFGCKTKPALTGYETVALAHLNGRFVINPLDICDEQERLEEIGKEIGDYLFPLGIYNGYYLVAGKSKRIYTIAPNIAVAGNDFEDFLCRFYRNEKPISYEQWEE